MACGTGATASAVAFALANYTAEDEVTVKLLGGSLYDPLGPKQGTCADDRFRHGSIPRRDRDIKAICLGRQGDKYKQRGKTTMYKVNDNYLKLPGSYLFAAIGKKVNYICRTASG